MKTIGQYVNGNYQVTIFDDGTKIRENNLDFFAPAFPESFDFKITNQCDLGCAMCHEDSRPDGAHGDIMALEFVDQLHPFTEIAIGGGNPLSHPDLVPFLNKCRQLKLIPSITVNQRHFMGATLLLRTLADSKLLHGIGVSLATVDDSFIDAVKQFPNAVIHVIAGLTSLESLQKLANNNLKILILGYKRFRRGESLYTCMPKQINAGIKELRDSLKEITEWFDVVSFDNLAIEQLEPRRILTDKQYDEFFMGKDGFATMYVDAVTHQFAKSSTSTERYPIQGSLTDMFDILRR